MKSKSYIPDGYQTATPYLTVDDATRALEFYRQAFGATELMRLDMPGGKIAHAEIQIGSSRIMLADEFPEWGTRSAKTLGGSPTSLMLYVPDCDAVFARAVAAGATPTMPVGDQFYGDRCGKVNDPFGHSWMIATNKEELTPEEIGARARQIFGGG
jgi:PhnB protein